MWGEGPCGGPAIPKTLGSRQFLLCACLLCSQRPEGFLAASALWNLSGDEILVKGIMES